MSVLLGLRDRAARARAQPAAARALRRGHGSTGELQPGTGLVFRLVVSPFCE